jgi:hypothetical protein
MSHTESQRTQSLRIISILKETDYTLSSANSVGSSDPEPVEGERA